VGVFVAVFVEVDVQVGVFVKVLVGVFVAVFVGVGVQVGVFVKVLVAVFVAVFVEVDVQVGVFVAVLVGEGVDVAVFVCVLVAVEVMVGVCVQMVTGNWKCWRNMYPTPGVGVNQLGSPHIQDTLPPWGVCMVSSEYIDGMRNITPGADQVESLKEGEGSVQLAGKALGDGNWPEPEL
jgi:hypothetical protein